MEAPNLRCGLSRRRFSTWAPFPIAVLIAVAATMGIVDPRIYARETASWAAQGIGQDWINAIVCAPALLASGAVALRGSRRARVLVGGLLLYTAYSFAIYAVEMHFNGLFLVYCSLLGGSTFALIDLVVALSQEGTPSWRGGRALTWITAVTLLGVAAVFGLLWLAQIIPALVNGVDPEGLQEVGLVANPVHVLDLSLLLPAMVIAGVELLRRRPLGNLLAPILLGFSVMMALAIGGMVDLMYVRHVTVDLTPVIAMAIVASVCLAVLVPLLRGLPPR